LVKEQFETPEDPRRMSNVGAYQSPINIFTPGTPGAYEIENPDIEAPEFEMEPGEDITFPSPKFPREDTAHVQPIPLKTNNIEIEVIHKKRKAKGVPVDVTTIIDSKIMKANLESTDDIVRDIIPAPPTKKQMLEREREIEWQRFPQVLLPVGSALRSHLSRDEEKMLSPPEAPRGAPVDRSLVEREPEQELEPEPFGPSSPAHFELYEEEPIEFPTMMENVRPVFTNDLQGTDIPEELTKLSHKSNKMLDFLDQHFTPNSIKLSFRELLRGKPRELVVGCFFECLVLKSKNFIELQQEEPYSDITIIKTKKTLSV